MSDDKIAEIKARHEEGGIGKLPMTALAEAHDDRGFLLAEVEQLRAERDSLKALFLPISKECARELKLGTMEALLSCPDDMTTTDSGAHRLAHLVVQWDAERKHRAEVGRLREARDALRDAAREYLETLGGAMKSGKFQMGGSAEMAHFVRQAMQKLDSLVFDRDGPRPAGLEKLHEPLKRPS